MPVAVKAGTAWAAGKAAGLCPAPDPSQLDSWLAIAPDGHVTLYCGKVELGGGVQTGMAQIAAEELDVPFTSVTVVSNDTTLAPDQGITAGSFSIWMGGPTIRQVSADARAVLLQHAAAHLGAPMSGLTVKDGVVRVKGSSAKSVS
jgi:CO/xanthine dehydrogenase Mo-binding subunit